MDTQHRKLIDFVNRANEYALSKDLSKLHLLLNDVSTYTREHFSDEEKLMQLIGYKGLGEHIKQHDELLESLTNFMEEATKGDVDQAAFAKFLEEWLARHILDEDMKYKANMT